MTRLLLIGASPRGAADLTRGGLPSARDILAKPTALSGGEVSPVEVDEGAEQGPEQGERRVFEALFDLEIGLQGPDLSEVIGVGDPYGAQSARRHGPEVA